MSFIDDSEKNVKRLMETTAGGGVGGFVGRAGREIDRIFGGPFHPDSGHGSENEKLLQKQIDDRKKMRINMENEAYEDGVELIGTPAPVGGYYAEIGETEGIELAYEELIRFDELNREYNEAMTPPQQYRWEEVLTNLEYDDNSNLYAGDNYINKSATNWQYIDRGDE